MIQNNFSPLAYLQQYALPLLITLAFFLYSKTIVNEYCIDDFLVTKNHPLVAKGIAGIGEIFTTRYMLDEDMVGEYRPVARASYAVEYEFFGFNPYVSHFFNALFYALSCGLFFKVVLKVFGPTYFHVLFIGTLLFIAHPSHSEVVASLKNRENIFSFLLPLGGIWLLLGYFDTHKLIYVAGAYILFILGLLSKIDAIEFAVIAALVIYYYTGSIKKATLIMVSQVVIMYVMIAIRENTLPEAFAENAYIENPLIEDKSLESLVSLTAATLWYYLKLMLAPGQMLFYYGYNMIPMPTIKNSMVWGTFTLHAIAGIVALWGIYHKKIWAFGIIWYLGTIAFFSQLIEPVTGIVGERHAFIASAGFFIAIGWLIYNIVLKIFAKAENIQYIALYTVTSIIVLFWSSNVLGRIPAWQTEDILFDTDMPHLKNSAHGNYIYGINLKDRAELPQTDSLKHLQYMQQATQAFKRATEIYPHFARLWYSLSLSYNTIDSSNLGIAAMKKAYSLDTTHRSVNYFMAMFTLNDTKDTLRAIQLLENEMLLRKENINALGLLITLYKQKKLTQKAFVFLSVLVKNNPENYQPYLTLANIYLARNDTFNYKNYYSIAVQKSKNAPPEFFY